MARCRQCNTPVGCGCQLTNGLCPSCYSISLQTTNPNTQNVQSPTK